MQKKKDVFFKMRLLLSLFVLFTSISVWADGTSQNVDADSVPTNKIKGAGTSLNPYLIADSLDWVAFADSVTNGVSYDGKYFRMTADITVSKMAGLDDKRFMGTFDGGCHTMTLKNLSSSTETCAPFRYVNGATIKNLHTTGTIIAGSHSSNDKYRSGIVGNSGGRVVIDNCWSSVIITTSINGDGTHGGFVGVNDGILTITNSLFDGTISGSNTYANSGFVGWTGDHRLVINNCLMAGVMNVKSTNGATFARGNSNNTASNIIVTNSYYVTSYGTIQGTAVGEMTNEDLLGALGSVWEIKDEKVVPVMNYQNLYTATVAGLERPLAWTGSTIDVNYDVMDAYGNVLTQGTDYTSAISPEEVLEEGEYTLTITGINSYKGTKTVSFNVIKKLSGAGTLENPYMISNANDWNIFSANVNAGNDYINTYVKLADEFDNSESLVTVQVGIGVEKSFSGTLLGNNKTLYVNLTNTDNETNEVAQGEAPFHYIKNATIKDLTIAGTISSASYHTSGLVGFADGENLLEGCVVNATLNITNNYAGGIVGHGRSSATTIKDCIFAGTINGGGSSRSNIGGIWGWSNTGNPKLQNCLEKGTYTSISSMHPIGLQGNSGSVTDCYYLNEKKGSPSNVCSLNGAVRVYTAEQTEKITKYQALLDSVSYYIEGNSTITGLKSTYDEIVDSIIDITYGVNYNNAALTEGTDYTATITDSDNNIVTDSVSAHGVYTLTVTGMGDYRGTMTKSFIVLRALPGDGSEAAPYLINNSTDWDDFATNVTNGITYKGKYVKLTDSITVTKMAGLNETNSFQGIFLGTVGKTMTLNLTSTAENCAPFVSLKNATIKDLTIDGTVTTGYKLGASIAAHTYGTTNIRNCVSTVEISGTFDSEKDGTFAGLVAVNEGSATLNFDSCMFIGKLLGSKVQYNGGFVGYNNRQINYTDCLFAPAEITMSTTGSATFNRNGSNGKCSFTRTYYLTQFGEAQGIKVVANVPEADIYKEITAVDSVSYNAICGVKGVEEYYLYTGDVVSVTPVVSFGTEILTLGTDYTVTIKNSEDSIVAPDSLKESGNYTITIAGMGDYKGAHTVAFHIFKGEFINGYAFETATDDDGTYYMIKSAEDFERLAACVNSADNVTKDKRFVQMNNITVNTMLGTSEKRSFQGIYDGGKDTLTLDITASQNIVAPFSYINGATIKDVVIAGTINNSGKQNGGVAGYSYGSVNISNCIVSASITCSYTGDSSNGGFIAHIQTGDVTFSNCAFTGSLLGSSATCSGGFVGWRDNTNIKITYNNCLFAPAEVTMSAEGSSTFNRNKTDNNTYNGCYYLTQHGDAQGVKVLADAPVSGLYKVVTASDGNTYYMSCDITGISDLYVYTDDVIEVTPVVKLNNEILTIDTDYTVTIKNSEDSIVAPDSLKERGKYTITVTGTGNYKGSQTFAFSIINGEVLNGYTFETGTDEEGTFYMINNAEDFQRLAAFVNSAENVSAGKRFVQMNNLTINTTVGDSDKKNFQGIYDGGHHTLTLDLTATANDCAPFATLKDATVKNLNIDGTISTGYKYSSSIAGHTFGTNYIQNCVSTVEITSTFTTAGADGTHAGFVGENGGSLNFSNCVFKGKLLGGNAIKVSGFLGWNQGEQVSYTDCLFAPAEVTMSAEGSATFNRNGKNTFTRTYYLESFGEVQGKQVYVADNVPATGFYGQVSAADGNPYFIETVISNINDSCAYTGDAIVIEPTFSIEDETPAFVAGVDYEVSFSIDGNPVDEIKEVGDYVITITGKDGGKCKGSFTKDFKVYSTVPTGIATTKEAGVKNHDIYTIGGVKLNGKSAKKGLYIKNGVVISVK